MKRILFLAIFLFCAGAVFKSTSFPDEINTGEIFVLGESDEKASEFYENSELIENKWIEFSKAASFDEILNYFGSVDIKRRGNEDIQNDISIRGGNFEEVLISIEGIPFHDSQSGHFSSALPIMPEDIENVEIKKTGYSDYGISALSGAVNLNLKKIKGEKNIFALKYGENGFKEYKIRHQNKIKDKAYSFSFLHKESDGYIYDTDFNINIFNSRGVIKKGRFKAEAFGGMVEKNYGAYNFYTNIFPDEYEETKSYIGFIKGELDLENYGEIKGNIFFRKLQDYFVLVRENPDFFNNLNKNYSKGFNLNYSRVFENLAGEIKYTRTNEKVKSSNLGNRKRNLNIALIKSEINLWNKVNLFSSYGKLFVDNGEDDDSWIIRTACAMSEKSIIRFTVEKSYRIPSFTELYYKSPGNIGNANLNNENMKSYDLSLYQKIKNLNLIFSLYYKENYDLIDWVREKSDSPYESLNIGKFVSKGAEIFLEAEFVNKSMKRASLSYAYNRIDRDFEKQSKYVFNYPEHSIKLNAYFKILNNIGLFLNSNYTKRKGKSSYYVLNLKAEKSYNINHSKLNIFISADNLLNRSYEEIDYIKMPGRWIKVGCELYF